MSDPLTQIYFYSFYIYISKELLSKCDSKIINIEMMYVQYVHAKR